MKFFKELKLIESEMSAQKEATHVINMINASYAEWKKIGRRKNAVDIVTTTANKLSTIDPAIVDNIHDATRIKMASLILRCFDIPYWKSISEKEKIYNKLLPLIQKLENQDPQTDAGGNLKEAIFTRLSASVCFNSENKNVYVAYEPRVSSAYLRYLFGKEVPEKTYRMQLLSVPGTFEELANTLSINHEKAVKKFKTENAT